MPEPLEISHTPLGSSHSELFTVRIWRRMAWLCRTCDQRAAEILSGLGGAQHSHPRDAARRSQSGALSSII
jgi:hypothetical protein